MPTNIIKIQEMTIITEPKSYLDTSEREKEQQELKKQEELLKHEKAHYNYNPIKVQDVEESSKVNTTDLQTTQGSQQLYIDHKEETVIE